MYKSKLQELCQRRSWSLPEYETHREGPPHKPHFSTTVTVNSIPFRSTSPSPTAKKSQDSVAMLAFHHFSQPKPNPIIPHHSISAPSSSSSTGSPGRNTNVSNILPTNRELQPNLEAACPTSQISSPVATVTDITKAQAQKSSPGHSPNVSNILTTNRELQPDLEAACQTSQNSSPVATVTDITKAQDQKSLPGHSPDISNIPPTNRELQPNLEAACQTSQISSPVTTVTDITKAQDQKSMLHLYKNKLQCYAQKKNRNLPVYSSEWEGPPHAMRFKCKVTIDGQTFESPKLYSTLKDAEHAAAEIALMSLSPSGVQEKFQDNTGLYKNLLQEFVQKEGFHLPVYSTNKSGEAHMPIFVSQVEVEGELFIGQESKSKKHAEMSAAKVAFTTLKERKARQGQASEFSPNCLEANVITGLQHHSNRKSPVSPGLVIRNQPNKEKVENESSSLGTTDGGPEDSSLSNGKPVPSFSVSNNVASETSDMSSTAVSAPSRRKKIVVYSRKTNVPIEDGGTLLPISDDKWVAYSYSQ